MQKGRLEFHEKRLRRGTRAPESGGGRRGGGGENEMIGRGRKLRRELGNNVVDEINNGRRLINKNWCACTLHNDKGILFSFHV